MILIDTHAHIYYDDYSDRMDAVIQAAFDNGVEKIITVGVDLSTSEECIRLSEKYHSVYATCGYHPHEAVKAPKGYLYELESFYSHSKVVAVGEIGVRLGWSCVAVGCSEHRGGLKMGEVWLKNGRDGGLQFATSEHRWLKRAKCS